MDDLLVDVADRCRDSTAAERVLDDIRSTRSDSGAAETVALLHRIVAAGKARPAATVESALADALALTVAMVREAELRKRWADAASSMSARVLSGGGRRPLDHVPRCAAQAACADFGALTLATDPTLLRLRAVSGQLDSCLVGTCPAPGSSLAGRVVRTGRAVLAEEYPEVRAVGPVAMVPLERGDEVIGALAVGRVAGSRSFTPADLDDLGAFAAHAAGVVEFAWSGPHRNAARRDSDEAAAELTDHVVGDLFAVGLGLQGLVSVTTAPAHRDRLTRYVDSIAAATARVRDFFSAEFPRRTHPVPLSLRLLSTVDAAELMTGSAIRVAITGSVNLAVPPELADDIVAVVRDALGTVADAELIELSVGCDGSAFTMTVVDNGVAALARSRLVARLRYDAEGHRSVRSERAVGGGNRLVWTARFR